MSRHCLTRRRSIEIEGERHEGDSRGRVCLTLRGLLAPEADFRAVQLGESDWGVSLQPAPSVSGEFIAVQAGRPRSLSVHSARRTTKQTSLRRTVSRSGAGRCCGRGETGNSQSRRHRRAGRTQRLEGIPNGLEVLLASKAVGRKPRRRLIYRSPSFASLPGLLGRRIGSSDEKRQAVPRRHPHSTARGPPRPTKPRRVRRPTKESDDGKDSGYKWLALGFSSSETACRGGAFRPLARNPNLRFKIQEAAQPVVVCSTPRRLSGQCFSLVVSSLRAASALCCSERFSACAAKSARPSLR